MSVSRNSLLTTLLVLTGLCSVSPVSAQGYHYGYGSSRVVNQNNIGLSNHDSSYISPGCISDSAKGVVRNGYRPNPLLPQVNLGRTVKTAGDNLYQGGAPYLETNSLYQPRPVVRRNNNNNNRMNNQPRQKRLLSWPECQFRQRLQLLLRSAMTYGESDNYKNGNAGNSNSNSSYSYGR